VLELAIERFAPGERETAILYDREAESFGKNRNALVGSGVYIYKLTNSASPASGTNLAVRP
jgi:hypothetical protein